MLKVIFLLNFPIFFFLAGFLFENIISFKFALFSLISNIFAQSMQIKHVSCERSELRQPSAVFASKAQSKQIKQIKHVSCERSELRQPSAVFASKAQSKQIKQIKHVSCERSELRQPSAVFANQLKQASQAQSMLAKRANQPSYARLHSSLRLPSPTGRRRLAGYASYYDCTIIYREGTNEGRRQKVALNWLKIGYV